MTEDAAGTLGASPPLVFLVVTLPLILPGVIAGMILCFAKAMGEFGATITFVSNIPGETQTLPTAIYTFTQVPGGEAGAMRLTVISVAISVAALLGSELMARSRRAQDHAGMSLEVEIDHRQGAFRLRGSFRSDGRLTALFGRSGSGKTTLVNVIAGLIRPERGRIAVDGATLLDTQAGVFVPKHRRRIGYVFQEGRLFPHLSVRQNLLFGRWFAGREGGARTRASDLDAVVALLGIGHLLRRRPAGLSGGEKQRVAIGRALLARPRLLLMDEPLASLDEARKAEILPFIERLRDEAGVPIVYVSHAVGRGGAARHDRRRAGGRPGGGRRRRRRRARPARRALAWTGTTTAARCWRPGSSGTTRPTACRSSRPPPACSRCPVWTSRRERRPAPMCGPATSC